MLSRGHGMDTEARRQGIIDQSEPPYFAATLPQDGYSSERVTSLPTGRSPARTLWPLAGWIAGSWVMWGGFGFVAARGLLQLNFAWPQLVAGALLFVAGIVASSTLHSRAYDHIGQRRAAVLLRSTCAWGPFAAGVLAAWVSHRPDFGVVLPRLREGYDDAIVIVGVAIVGALSVVRLCTTLFRLPRALRHAFADQAHIATLRQDGVRHSGVLSVDRTCSSWIHDEPQLRGTVRFDSPSRGATVGLRTSTGRVPVNGTRVIVFARGADVHVELDPAHPPQFAPLEQYAVPDG